MFRVAIGDSGSQTMNGNYMRTYGRLLGIAAATTAVIAMGSPAFAGGHPDIKGNELEAAFETESESGNGGESANVLSCLINVPLLSPNSDQECSPNSSGGDSEAETSVED